MIVRIGGVNGAGFFSVLFLVVSVLSVSADMDWNVLDLSAPRKTDLKQPPKCRECHQEIFNTVLSLPGKHSIVVLRECEKCHLADRTKSSGYRALGQNDWRQIEIRDYANEHLVILRNISGEKKYFVQVDVRDRAGKTRRSEKILFTARDVSEYWVDDKKPPALTGIAVSRVNLAVLPSADISVKSNKMVKVKVSYGFSGKYNFVSYSDRYKKTHRIRLKGLRSKKSYHFNVSASDPFGNTTVSEDFTFSTVSPVQDENQMKREKESGNLILYPPKVVRFLGAESEDADSPALQDIGSGLAVFISSTNEVTVSLRLKEADPELLKSNESRIHGRWGLKGRLESGIDVCNECHFQGASHPVGMRSKGKTVIPKDLPTAKGGVMTCATCHNPHGSKFPFLARVDFSKKLCTMCHQGNFL